MESKLSRLTWIKTQATVSFLNHDKKSSHRPTNQSDLFCRTAAPDIVSLAHSQIIFYADLYTYLSTPERLSLPSLLVINDKEAEWKNQVKEELKHGVTKANNLPSTLIIFSELIICGALLLFYWFSHISNVFFQQVFQMNIINYRNLE